MTKKDYELITSIISKYRGIEINKAQLIHDFTTALREDNKRFNISKFVVACLGLDFKDQDAVVAEADYLSEQIPWM